VRVCTDSLPAADRPRERILTPGRLFTETTEEARRDAGRQTPGLEKDAMNRSSVLAVVSVVDVATISSCAVVKS
jgi:hypothetical protein